MNYAHCLSFQNQCYSKSLTCDTLKCFYAQSNHKKSGFTLIELLVVVLIIGILASVAVPQYQKAVAKSKYATLKNLVTTIHHASNTYYLETVTYPTDLDELAVDFGGTPDTTNPKTKRIFPWGYCSLGTRQIACHNTDIDMVYFMLVKPVPGVAIDIEDRLCQASASNAITTQICQDETDTTEPLSEYVTYKDHKIYKYR